MVFSRTLTFVYVLPFITSTSHHINTYITLSLYRAKSIFLKMEVESEIEIFRKLPFSNHFHFDFCLENGKKMPEKCKNAWNACKMPTFMPEKCKNAWKMPTFIFLLFKMEFQKMENGYAQAKNMYTRGLLVAWFSNSKPSI